jgi:hypothetical protein
METAEVGSILTEHSDAMQIQTIGAEVSLHVTIDTQTPTERTRMNIRTKIKMTIERVVSMTAVLLAITCIGVRCCLVTPSA